MMKELHLWMEMLARFTSTKGVPERFIQLKALAEMMGDAATHEEMLEVVTGEVMSESLILHNVAP